MPDIKIVKPFYDEEAKKLVKLCPANVFDIEDFGSCKYNLLHIIDLLKFDRSSKTSLC